MKKYIFLLIAIISISYACKKKDFLDNKPDNAVYMGNVNSSDVLDITVSDDKGGLAVVTPRLANISEKPVTIVIGVDKATLDKYNEKNNLDLEPMNAEDFAFIDSDGKVSHGEATVTIQPGEFEASVQVKIDSINVKKYPYSKRLAIPILIKNVSNFKLLSQPQWTLVKLNRQLRTSIGEINSLTGGISVKPKTPYAAPMKEWTFQMSMIYRDLTRGNLTTAYISSSGGGEFYTRINASQGIQIKNGRDGDDTWTQKKLATNVWLHIAYVYKERSLSVYVNGELQKTFETTEMYLANSPESGWTIGNDNYKNNDYIREVRFWNKALSQAEIMDKLYLPQDPNTPGLLMYMPFTKEAGVTELTGKWNVSINPASKISFIDNVLFPATKLEIAE